MVAAAGIGAVVAFICLFVAGVYLTVQLDGRLRREHPAVWNELGRPSIWNNSIKGGIIWTFFVWRSRYRMLGDGTLERIARRLKIVQGIYIGVFVLIIVLLAVG